MKKHLGWIARLLIAAAGVGYILYALDWSDQIFLPAGYETGVGIVAGEDGDSFKVLDESEQGYRIGVPSGSDEGEASVWIAKSALTADTTGPRFSPSVASVLGAADRALLFLGLGLIVPIYLIGAARWMLLMRARGINAAYWRTYRLTMAGLFFNLCMPGTTGGDVMKAFYAAKGSERRGDAAVSVAIDRICGLVGLILLACIAGLFSLDDPLIRRLTLGMWLLLAGLLVFAAIYTSQRLRARLGLGRLVGKVPGAGVLRKIDSLIAAYRHHRMEIVIAIGMSLPIHLVFVIAMSLAGYSLGIDRSLLFLLGTIPFVFLLWALPVSGPLGLGPLEIFAVALIVGGGQASEQQVLIMFVIYRLYMVMVGLVGSLALLGSGTLSIASKDVHHKPPIPGQMPETGGGSA